MTWRGSKLIQGEAQSGVFRSQVWLDDQKGVGVVGWCRWGSEVGWSVGQHAWLGQQSGLGLGVPWHHQSVPTFAALQPALFLSIPTFSPPSPHLSPQLINPPILPTVPTHSNTFSPFNSSLPSTKDVPLLSGKHDWGPWHTAVCTLILNSNLLGHIANDPLLWPWPLANLSTCCPPAFYPDGTPIHQENITLLNLTWFVLTQLSNWKLLSFSNSKST